MTAERIEIDSQIMGKPVLAISDFDATADFTAFERAYLLEFSPFYVSCKVLLDDVAAIHALETAGFQLVECQLRSVTKLRKPYDVSAFPYSFERVLREEDLDEILKIAASTFIHDRYRMDPSLPPEFASRRYPAYVRNSFHSPDEAVYRLLERDTGRTVAFKTHRYLGPSEALFLLGGVHPDMKELGLGLVNNYFEFNKLMSDGINRATTHISAANYGVFNLEFRAFGFRLVAAFAVLRKIYAAA